jgi:hypothetical protein
MPNKTLFVTVLLGSFLVACVAPAGADDWDRKRSQRRMDTRRIESLSHRIERGVTQVRREAERRYGDRRHRGHATLRSLHQLERRADWFHQRVERRPLASRRLYADFRSLQESFRATDARVRYLHSRHLHRDLRRVAVLLGELERELQRSLRMAGNHGPRPKRDHGRDWRDHSLAWNW